jgi:hypothetical protein
MPNSIQFELNSQHPDVFCHINSKFDLIFMIPLKVIMNPSHSKIKSDLSQRLKEQ